MSQQPGFIIPLLAAAPSPPSCKRTNQIEGNTAAEIVVGGATPVCTALPGNELKVKAKREAKLRV